MSELWVTAVVFAGFSLAAWFRFDAGSVLLAWGAVVLCLLCVAAGSILRARRLPRTHIPQDLQELSSRDPLTAEQESQVADAFRAWHRDQQRLAWRETVANGPRRLITGRATFYFFWLTLPALIVVPPSLVPNTVVPWLPRFVIVLSPILAAAVALAVPLGVRDWKRARRSLNEP